MITRYLVVALTMLLSAEASGGKIRKVPCPAQCDAGEVADSTQQCTWHDKELYKVDGIGCKKYEMVCWCKPEVPKLPEKTTL